MTVTAIIGPNGGADFATPALWFASFAAVLLDHQTGNCQNAEITVTATQTLSGVTAGVFNVLLTAGATNSFVDNAGKLSNALRFNTSNGAAIRMTSGSTQLLAITCANFTLSRLMLKKDSAYDVVVAYIDNSFTGRVIDQCIVVHGGASETGSFGVSLSGGATMTNSLVYNVNNTHGIRNATGDSIVQDITIVCLGAGTSVTGFGATYGAPLLKNVVVAGYATDYSGTAGTCANNATDKGSFGGTNYGTTGQVSVVKATEWEDTTATTEDFRVKSGSAKLANNGTASGTPTTDIVGSARSGSTPTIGAWELGAAAPSSRNFWRIQ